MVLDKKLVRQLVEGHRVANTVQFRERARWLQRLTPQEARQIFDALCATWQTLGARQPLGDLEKGRIQFLIERRRRFDALARRQGTAEKDNAKTSDGM
jgi:hypothetical protein